MGVEIFEGEEAFGGDDDGLGAGVDGGGDVCDGGAPDDDEDDFCAR